MKLTDYQFAYRRNLPHFQPEGATLFVTIRLAGSLPRYAIERLKYERNARKNRIRHKAQTGNLKRLLRDEDKRYFGQIDALLDMAKNGPTWMSNPAVAAEVYNEILCHKDALYDLDAVTIMPNHAHLVFRPNEAEPGVPASLSSIMMSVKGRSAHECNNILGRTGTFWQHESYDHVVRDPYEWERIVNYVLMNPVRAGLINDPNDWPWTYLRESDS